jgi:hypothetical protein
MKKEGVGMIFQNIDRAVSSLFINSLYPGA